MGFLLQQYFPGVNIMILDAISGAIIGLLYWFIFGRKMKRGGGAVVDNYKPDQFEQIENAINWPKVGPDEMEMIGRLRNAQGVQAKVIMRELAKRDALVLPEEYSPSAEERADDARYWASLALRIVVFVCVFNLVGALSFTYIRFDEWLNLPATAIWGRVFLTFVFSVAVCLIVMNLMKTDTWKGMIASGIIFAVVFIPLLIFFIAMTSGYYFKELEKLTGTVG